MSDKLFGVRIVDRNPLAVHSHNISMNNSQPSDHRSKSLDEQSESKERVSDHDHRNLVRIPFSSNHIVLPTWSQVYGLVDRIGISSIYIENGRQYGSSRIVDQP